MVSSQELIKQAKSVVKLYETKAWVRIGDVGAALETDKGNVYKGVSIHACCGVGFCCEHSAIAAMVTAGEYRIKKIVAVDAKGVPMPPCGRCREFMYQVNEKNLDTDVIISKKKTVKLKELLPYIWQEQFF